jgi:hypothetical protein
MDDNTQFLCTILRQDWTSYDTFMTEYARQGKGTPVAIIGSAFHLAVKRRFAPGKDMREIIRFVADARARSFPRVRIFRRSAGQDLPPREAEGLICANLDLAEPWIEEIVDRLDAVAIAEIEGQLLFKLISDESLSDEQLDVFLADAEHLLRQWQEQASR